MPQTKTLPSWAHKVQQDAVRTLRHVAHGLTFWAHRGEHVLIYGTPEKGDRFLGATIFDFEDNYGEPVMIVRADDGRELKLNIDDIHWFRPCSSDDLCRPVPNLISTIRQADLVIKRNRLTGEPDETPSSP